MKCQNKYYIYLLNYVALFTRAWIEISGKDLSIIAIDVALFTRAWIEIPLPRRAVFVIFVALFTRAWIEMYHIVDENTVREVALFTRAWIEISEQVIAPAMQAQSPSSRGRGLKLFSCHFIYRNPRSPSSRGRGLKFFRHGICCRLQKVALFTRAWIEIIHAYWYPSRLLGRPLHEGVD